jgi:hypothetical protein
MVKKKHFQLLDCLIYGKKKAFSIIYCYLCGRNTYTKYYQNLFNIDIPRCSLCQIKYNIKKFRFDT